MWPLIELAIEPKSSDDRDRLDVVLARMTAEDPYFQTSVDHESGQIVLKGWDEAWLDQKLAILADSHIDFNAGAPQVAYREMISCQSEIDYTHKRAYEGRGEFARVKLLFAPGAHGSGVRFVSTLPPGTLPLSCIGGAATGLERACRQGLVAGFPMMDIQATLVDAAYHDLDSSPRTFDIAARAAFKALRETAAPVLLEPIMTATVSVPHARLNATIDDLTAHRGTILKRSIRADRGAVTVRMPLDGLLGYSRRLTPLAGGMGEWSMAFDHYAPVPQVHSPPPDDVFPPAIGLRA